MTGRKPKGIVALEIRDASDSYAKERINEIEQVSYLRAIVSKEVERDNPRTQRIAWTNQRIAEVKE
ncbi:hypothetical protein HFTV1-gp57 [Haloferax tailed virus 1]|uniref:Uncharacterized protein n=1 Tax=Haloferax tailed virus 1 TaxID=2507575 RepID=A0A410N6Y0_HFTV1|nr:hypothetical protein M1M17_gp57 [Haloferax tailed virus 1]QAS68890.1 hypothetical protein HFTV1-gp57 [Haloferax tailed virus 1]